MAPKWRLSVPYWAICLRALTATHWPGDIRPKGNIVGEIGRPGWYPSSGARLSEALSRPFVQRAKGQNVVAHTSRDGHGAQENGTGRAQATRGAGGGLETQVLEAEGLGDQVLEGAVDREPGDAVDLLKVEASVVDRCLAGLGGQAQLAPPRC